MVFRLTPIRSASWATVIRMASRCLRIRLPTTLGVDGEETLFVIRTPFPETSCPQQLVQQHDANAQRILQKRTCQSIMHNLLCTLAGLMASLAQNFVLE